MHLVVRNDRWLSKTEETGWGGADTKKHTGTPVAQELVQDPDLHMCSEMGGKGTGAL